VRPRRARRVAAAALALAGIVVGVWAGTRTPGVAPGPTDGAAADEPTAARPPSDLRAGGRAPTPRVRGAHADDSPAATDASAGPDGAADRAMPIAAPERALAPAAARAAFTALAPTSVDDRIAPGADLPRPIARDDLVGRVGPYGVREPAASSGWTWWGLGRVLRAPTATADAADDTQAPITTAVRGRVVAEDGRPVAGAEVLLYSSFYLRQAYYDHRVRQLGHTRTDADGAFDLRPLALDTVHFGAGGAVLVTVRHSAYADLVAQPLPGIVPGQESDVGRLVLPTVSARVHGTVLDLSEQPVAGAVVLLSGHLNPVDYDKTERWLVLDACPSAVTDADGRYAIDDVAPGVHEISVHLRLDCVLHVRDHWQGDREWTPRVRAGPAIRGRVVDPDGRPVAAAVVAGGANWTPSNADGTFWLDNVMPGPLALEIVHHAWYRVVVASVPTDGDDVTLAFERPLPRVVLSVVDAAGAPASVVAIDWTWPPGGGPGPFAPDSRYWQGAGGVLAVVVAEGAVGATVTDAHGGTAVLTPTQLVDGGRVSVALSAPPPAPPAPAAAR